MSTIRLPESSALSIAQTAKYVFAGLPSGSIGVWRTSNLQHQRDLQGHTGSVLALQTVTDLKKTWLVSASADSTVRVWDANTCKPLWQIFPPTDGFGDIFSVAHSGNRIVFGTQSCALLVSETIRHITSAKHRLTVGVLTHSLVCSGSICQVALWTRLGLARLPQPGDTTSSSTLRRLSTSAGRRLPVSPLAHYL